MFGQKGLFLKILVGGNCVGQFLNNNGEEVTQYLKTLVFVFLSFACKATECADRYILLEHINLSICQNHSSYRETTFLLIKARAIKLNEYIDEKIQSGELKNKLFQISIYDPIMSSPFLELTQNKKNYNILVSGFPSLNELKTYVNYFGERNWTSFSTNSDNTALARKQVQDFLNKRSSVEMFNSTQSPLLIWGNSILELMYIGDSLQFFLEKKELEVSAKLDLPIFIKNRILVFEEREILVFESSKLIKRFNIERATYKDYDIYKGPNWVNICDGGEKNWIYTYSYKDNKFFRNPKN